MKLSDSDSFIFRLDLKTCTRATLFSKSLPLPLSPHQAPRPRTVKRVLLDDFEPVHATAQIEAQPPEITKHNDFDAQPPELRKHMIFLHL